MATYKDVLIITESIIKETFSLDKNVSVAYLKPIIRAVQDITLQQVIGTPLYDRIRQEIYADPSLSGHTDTKELVDYYIKDLLIYSMAAELQIPLSFKMRNVGVVQNSDVNSNPSTLDDIKFIKNYYNNFAEFYKNRVQDYLIENILIFPEFRQHNKYSDMFANENNYNCPIVLNNRGYRRKY